MSSAIQGVVGLGKTGLSLVRHLLAQGVTPQVWDTRVTPPALSELRQEFPQLVFHGGPMAPDALTGCQQLWLSPGLSRQEPAIATAIDAGIPVLGDVELFARQVQAPVIAITGSNGKSTVTSLVGELLAEAGLKVAVGGNIGTPVLELLDIPAQIYVLELSSFQLESTESLAPVAATILNLSEDHMDRYAGMTDYLAAKQRIYRQCQRAVVNREDPMTHSLALSLSFGLDRPEPGHFGLREQQGRLWLAQGEQLLLPVDSLKIKGLHNAANALAALALVAACGIDLQACLPALARFAGLPHRCQWVGSRAGADWYNDSKATNVGATEAALSGLGRSLAPGARLVLLAGGDGKGADFSSLTPLLAQFVDRLWLFGRDAAQIAAICPESVVCKQVETLAQAVEQAAQWVQPGDLVLLSPACASLDQFRNFEQRGQMFAELVTGS